jgi:hypothetical protein
MKRFAPPYVLFRDCRHSSCSIDQSILPIALDAIGPQVYTGDTFAAD